MFDQFDPDLPGHFQGDITSVTVIDPAVTGVSGQLRNLVIDPTQPFDVKVDWSFTGDLVKLWLAALKGNFVVSVYAESIGGGPELLAGSNSAIAASFNSSSYSATVNVPAFTLQEGDPGSTTSGIYKLVVSVFLDSNLGTPGYDIIGFHEGPIIQAENPL
jgi:hypothetical protein